MAAKYFYAAKLLTVIKNRHFILLMVTVGTKVASILDNTVKSGYYRTRASQYLNAELFKSNCSDRKPKQKISLLFCMNVYLQKNENIEKW